MSESDTLVDVLSAGIRTTVLYAVHHLEVPALAHLLYLGDQLPGKAFGLKIFCHLCVQYYAYAALKSHVEALLGAHGGAYELRRDVSGLSVEFEDQLALVGPPVISAVVLCSELDGGAVFFHTADGVVILSLVLLCDLRVRGVAAHILAPCGEAVLGAGHVSDECAGSPRKRAVVGDEQVVAVAVAADAGVAVLIGSDLDVVDGNSSGLLDRAELGVNKETELIGSGSIDQGVADGAVIGLRVVAADPQLDPCERVSCVFGKTELLGNGLALVGTGSSCRRSRSRCP